MLHTHHHPHVALIKGQTGEAWGRCGYWEHWIEKYFHPVFTGVRNNLTFALPVYVTLDYN